MGNSHYTMALIELITRRVILKAIVSLVAKPVIPVKVK
jgi:hypothetical protein